jgi:hypothetical protein
MSEGGIEIKNSFNSGLALAAVHIPEALEHRVVDVAVEALDYAKANAPWNDRTGDARAGLDTSVQWEGDTIVWDLYHQVDYGLPLETIQNGRFAIIMPTLEIYSAKVGSGLQESTEIDYADD